ncbi:MAG: hypothetical protein AAF628_15400 [Planctomycetota bacterium]
MRPISRLSVPIALAVFVAAAAAQPGPTGVFSFSTFDISSPSATAALHAGWAKYDGATFSVNARVIGNPDRVEVYDCVSGGLAVALLPDTQLGSSKIWRARVSPLGRSESSLLNDLFELRVQDSSGTILSRGKLQQIRRKCFVAENEYVTASLSVDLPTGRFSIDVEEQFARPTAVNRVFLMTGSAASPGVVIERLFSFAPFGEFEIDRFAPEFAPEFESGSLVLKLVTGGGDVFLDLAKKETMIGYASGPTAIAKVRLPLLPGTNEILGDGEAEGMTPTSGRILDFFSGQTLGTFVAADAAGSSFTLQTTLTASGMQTLRNGQAGVELTDGTNTIVGPAVAPIGVWSAGFGCVGSNGEQLLLGVDSPVTLMRGSFDFEIANAISDGTAALLVGGPTATLGIPIPVSLEGVGAPDCYWMGPFVVALPIVVDSDGRATLALPTQFSAFYSELNTQLLGLDPAANPLGVTSSNVLTIPLN